MRELCAPVDADMFEIKVLKRPIVALLESDQDRHHFAGMEAFWTPPGFRSCRVWEAVSIGMCFIKQKKVVYFAEKCYNTHQRTPLG